MKLVRWLSCVCLAMLCSPALAELQLLTEDTPPMSFMRDGEVSGFSVEVVRALLARTGDSGKIELMPWTRAFYLAQQQADIALFSIGAVTGQVPSHVYSAGYLEPDDIRVLESAGVVGDVCTVFLRADGTYEDLALNERATGPTPAELTRIPRRVCAVAGENKVIPLLAALRAGIITQLILDEQTARELRRRIT